MVWDGRQQGALSSDSAEQTLAALKGTLARLGLDETLVRVSETIDPLRQAPPLVEERKLQRLFAGESDLFPLRELGRGGMGVVHLAEQASLARQVAIKTTRSKDPAVARALVREACIMGALEHPNLVPVHALGLGEDGSPVLVMKRVEGVSWTELLNQPDLPAWQPLLVGHGDRLRGHIDILSQVSRALSFAHDRGVVHRDLKPDNVMIGRFGEVYLLDWGLALRLSERAAEPVSVVGTPGFLAPEMAKGDPTLVDARTDVYLRGATLYRVLTGRMPHEAPTLLGALLAAVNGAPPPMSNDVPAELVALVRVAMARDRAARLPSAEAFREGLAQYLISREVDVIVSDARASYARAEASMLTEGPASATAFRTLVEARFGLASAHRMRPGDLGIATQLDATVTKLVEHELALHSPGAARAFLSELASPPAALVQRVDALEEEVALERTASDELARKRREADATKMVRPLSRALVMGWTFLAPLALWIAWPALESGQGFLPWRALTFDLALLAVLGAIFFTLRKTLFATEGTARVSTAFLFWALGMAAADVVTVALGGSTNDATLHSETAGLVLASMATATVIRELWPAVLIAIATVLAVIVAPHFSPAFALLNASLAIPVSARAFRLHAARLRGEGHPARDPHGPNAVRG